jgi:hypothetical protein
MNWMKPCWCRNHFLEPFKHFWGVEFLRLCLNAPTAENDSCKHKQLLDIVNIYYYISLLQAYMNKSKVASWGSWIYLTFPKEVSLLSPLWNLHYLHDLASSSGTIHIAAQNSTRIHLVELTSWNMNSAPSSCRCKREESVPEIDRCPFFLTVPQVL